jgi:endonuclease/exonuclease/phosphatase (EEP) superfamily protein YafD
MLRGLLLFAFTVGLVGVAGFSLMPLLWRLDPRFVALEPAAPQFAAAAAILALGFALLKSGKAVMIALGIAAWNLGQFGPAAIDLSSARALADAEPRLKVVAFNLWYRNTDPAATLAYLAHSGADVIGLVEATPRLKDALAPLTVLYPYRVDCVGTDPDCEIMLLSKRPLRNATAGKVDGRYPYIAEGEIDWGGRAVTVAMTHLSWPFLLPKQPVLDATVLEPPLPEFPDVPRLTQSLQAANLASHVNGLPKNLVLMGDFNSASWSGMQAAFRAATGLDNRGHYLPSWPTFTWPIFRLPIDHVFVRGGARVTDLRPGPSVGSDHLPIEAEIGFGP